VESFRRSSSIGSCHCFFTVAKTPTILGVFPTSPTETFGQQNLGNIVGHLQAISPANVFGQRGEVEI
jgi:hypothetical protein